MNAFYYEETQLISELLAARDCNPLSARFWKILSTDRKNHTGINTGYKLMPSSQITPFAPLDRATHLKRAAFLQHQLWVTAYHDNELYPGSVSTYVV